MGGDIGEDEVRCVGVPTELVEGLMAVIDNAVGLWRRDVVADTEDAVLAGAVLIAAKIVASGIMGEEIETETLQ